MSLFSEDRILNTLFHGLVVHSFTRETETLVTLIRGERHENL